MLVYQSLQTLLASLGWPLMRNDRVYTEAKQTKLLNEIKGVMTMRMFSVTLSFEGHEWIEIVKAFDTLEAIRKAKLNAECHDCTCVECRIVF